MSIKVELELDDGSFTTRMIHAGETVRQFQTNVGGTITSISKLNESTGGLLGTLRDLTVTLGMARAAFENMRAITTGWAGDIIKVNAEMEKLSFLLRGMSQAADPLKEAANQIVFLRDAAKSAPFTLHALTDTFVKIKSTGIDPLKGAFIGLIDGIAAFGGSEQNLARAALAIQEMSGKGVVQTKELRRQLGQDIPRAVEIMSRALGVSQGELSGMMEHGTLEAKGAIAAFMGEMERSFGGSALQQMRTFNGMMSQSNTLLQNLALTAGNAGFFGAVKDQMRDMNTLLGSSAANGFAESIGHGMASVVGSLRGGLETVFEFKNEIVRLIEILGSAMLFRGFIGGATSMIGYIGDLRTEFTRLGTAWTAMQTKMEVAATQRWMMSLAGTTTAVSNLGFAARQTGSMLAMIGVGLGVAAEFALPLAVVIGSLALAFGLLSDKEKDAYDNMVKFGAESSKQVEDADKYLDRQKQILAAMEKQKATQGPFDSGDTVVSDSDIEAQRKRVGQGVNDVGKGRIDAAKKEGEAMSAVMQNNLDDQTRFESKAYDEAGVLRERKYAEDLKAAHEGHRDTESIQATFRQDNREAAIKYYEDMDQLLETHLRNSRMMQEMGNKDAITAGGIFDPKIIAAQKTNMEALVRLREQPLKPSLTEKPFDIDKAVEKALAKIDELKAGTAGMRAEMAGASSEAAKLAYMINEAASKVKNMGPEDNVRIKAVTTELMKQQAIYDEIDRRKTGQTKMETDVLRINLKLTQDIAALRAGADKTNEVDKFRTGVAEGAYSGMTVHQQLIDKFGQLSSTAKTAGEDMKQAFLAILPPINSVIAVLDHANMGFKSLPARAGGLNLPGFSSGNELTDKIIGGESGARGNSNAKNPNSSATGPAQFIESTWMEFLRALHPEILKGANPLASRSNLALSQEATGWYADQNAKKFAENGIAANATNLNLGHFLGGAGATAALSKPDDTLVRTIPELQKAILANQAVFSHITNVGDLKAWSAGRNNKTKPFYDGDSRESQPGGMSAAVRAADADNAAKLQIKNALEAKNKLTELEQAALAGIKAAQEDNGGKLSSYAAGRKNIRDGTGPDGKANTNPDDAEYANYLDYLKKKDAAEAASADRKKSRDKMTAAEAAAALLTESLAEKQADIVEQLAEERKFKFSSEYSTLRRKNSADELAAKTAVENGGMTQEKADKLIAVNEANLKDTGDKEIMAALKTEQAKTIAIEKSMMTVGEARDKELADNIRRNEQYLALYTGTGEQRVAVEAQITRNITALRKQQFDLTPIGGMVKQWSDYSNNLQQASTGWMNTFNDKLADMVIKGQASWRGLTQAILSDLVKIALKAAESKLIGSFLGMGIGGTAATAGADGLAAIHHTGGIAGAAMPTRSVPFDLFAGAQRFHTGGFPGLDSSEIPIIAKRGEQVDWPENLARQYGKGSSSVSQVNNINVGGGQAGGPSQNKDLAAQIAAHVQEAAKAMVGQEFRTQMRPGGTIHAMIKG